MKNFNEKLIINQIKEKNYHEVTRSLWINQKTWTFHDLDFRSLTIEYVILVGTLEL